MNVTHLHLSCQDFALRYGHKVSVEDNEIGIFRGVYFCEDFSSSIMSSVPLKLQE